MKNIKETSLNAMQEDKFVDLLLAGWNRTEAAKSAFDVGSKMKGVVTTDKLNRSAAAIASRKLKNLRKENADKLMLNSERGVNKLEELMDAKKGIFVMGKRVDEEPDNSIQLQAAVKTLEFAGLKPTEKKEVTHKTFFDHCVKLIETDDDGNIIEGEVIDE